MRNNRSIETLEYEIHNNRIESYVAISYFNSINITVSYGLKM